jgi:hypothetical protein
MEDGIVGVESARKELAEKWIQKQLAKVLDKYLPESNTADEELRQERIILEIEDKIRELWKLPGDRNW